MLALASKRDSRERVSRDQISGSRPRCGPPGQYIRAFDDMTPATYARRLRHNDPTAAIKESLGELGLDYIDLYLIHGPIGGPQMRLESWRAICDSHKDGKLKSIGISTFGVRHMQELFNSGLPLPVIHQVTHVGRLPILVRIQNALLDRPASIPD